MLPPGAGKSVIWLSLNLSSWLFLPSNSIQSSVTFCSFMVVLKAVILNKELTLDPKAELLITSEKLSSKWCCAVSICGDFYCKFLLPCTFCSSLTVKWPSLHFIHFFIKSNTLKVCTKYTNYIHWRTSSRVWDDSLIQEIIPVGWQTPTCRLLVLHNEKVWTCWGPRALYRGNPVPFMVGPPEQTHTTQQKTLPSCNFIGGR